MSIPKNKALANEVAALIRGQPRSWAQVSCVLDQVERSGYWEGRAQSFSEWLESTAPKIGVKQSSLWRYLSAGRYYMALRPVLRGRNVPCPPLEKLPETVSPENLEILAKLERVVPKKLFEYLGERVLGGTVARHELREIWKTYRPVLAGRTARGRGTATPRVNPADTRQIAMQREATTLTELMSAGPEWTGINNPYFYYAISDVSIPKAGPEKRCFDMVGLVRETEDSPVMMIGVEVKTVIDSEVVLLLQSLAWYCDRLWVAFVAKVKIPDVAYLPEFVGILRADAGKFKVERPANEAHPGLGMKTGEMAKELLMRVLRS
jgi:hypothetical protein